VLRLRIPPLRERGADIALYARHFLEHYAAAMNRRLTFTAGAIELLSRYPWPGNVRELQNTVERVAVVCPDGKVDTGVVAKLLGDDSDTAIRSFIADSEADEIKQALAAARGKYGAAAALLGVSRSTLWRKLRRLGLK
jgi:DNA-binding NtrC family response regulator